MKSFEYSTKKLTGLDILDVSMPNQKRIKIGYKHIGISLKKLFAPKIEQYVKVLKLENPKPNECIVAHKTVELTKIEAVNLIWKCIALELGKPISPATNFIAIAG